MSHRRRPPGNQARRTQPQSQMSPAEGAVWPSFLPREHDRSRPRNLPAAKRHCGGRDAFPE
eukprot:4079194-Alexandrium_andersonii.AAC.1